MLTAPLDVVPLWIMFLAFGAFLLLAIEGGYRLGQWRRLRISDEKEQPVGAMVASILGLVALVLGFSFSLAASRFEARRMAVLEESNAIGTAYLRAQLLPEPQRSEIQRLLREYVEVRIRGVEEGKTEQALARSEALHELLWAQAAAASEKDTRSVITGVFIQSLNDVIDLHAKRVLVGLRSRIPLVIWIGLFGLAMLGMASVGYQAALCATRRSPAMLALVLTFAVVLLLIADLDRGQEGLLRISQHSMLDLHESIESPTDEHQVPGP
jgi:hypothetical protein